MPEVASQTLDFVGRELNITLAEARTALENYVEQPDNVTLLERCTLELHQVQGVLRVLEIYGAALLAEEMEQVASYLLATATERKSQAESLDALMRAMVQLPSYLERVLAGGRDLALVLLPLLNDLRAVRGSALLSEGTLLLLNLKSDKQAQPMAAAPGEPPLTVEQWARRLRARFQVGLIGWIRGERTEQNLDILAAVAQKLEQIATRQPLFQLWWVIGAIIEALQENGIEGGVSVKRLLGLGDREIRRLYEQGEARYSQSPAVELLNNLLYYVGRAESSGPRVTAVRASFRLSELLPVDESIEQERENLSAPSVKLMQTVAAAIREDLSKVKDVLDIFVRRGAGQPKELSPQVELLRKIGDTLGVLGLGELRGKVQGETERLEKIVNGTLKADEATLVTIAATLIGVEDRLDDGLVGMIRPKNNGLEEPSEDVEFQQVQSAVLRECILNLALIKEAITQNVGGTLDAAGLDSWQELMRGMKAGLLMLGKARAVEVIEAVTGQLKRVMQPGARALPVGFMDRLADAIVSVEYYMETLQAGRSDPWYMLDNAQSCVQALEQQQTPAVPTVPAMDAAAFAKTVQISNTTGTFFDVGDPSATLVGAAAPTISSSRSAKLLALAENADPELVKLFIEEAHEELVKIQRYFPSWDQNPMERESLVTVRRSFHTLKGSGRMVGARELGEFAWSIENLLNRVLDNTLTRTPAILGVLREAVSALPELIEQLETGRKPRVDMAALSARAHALAAGRQPVTPRAAPVEQAGEEAAEQSTGSTATVAVATFAGAPKPLTRPTTEESAAAFSPSASSQTATVVGIPSSASASSTSESSSPRSPTSTTQNFASSFAASSPSQSPATPSASTHGLTDSGSTAPSSVSASPGSSSGSSSPAFGSPGSASGSPSAAFASPDNAASHPSSAFASEASSEFSQSGPSESPLIRSSASSSPTTESPMSPPWTSASPPASSSAQSASKNASARSEAASSGTVPLGGLAASASGAASETALTFGSQDDAKPPGLDEVLREIYARETNTHIATVRAYIEREAGLADPHVLPEDVYRACHTLSGSSKMAQARHGTRVAEPLDHWLRRAFASGLGLQQKDLTLLADCMVAMESVATHLDEPTGYFVSHWALQERIGAADKNLDQRIAAAAAHAEEQSSPSADELMSEEESEASDDAGDFDAEVAAIFTEEAMELIDASEHALSDWREEPASAEYRSALKRPLHTLKGGARMAGIMAMGDLSHELETLVMQVDNGSVAANGDLFEVVQASLDELARMRELVANGRRVAPARAMIARIQGLSRPKTAQAASPPPPAPRATAPFYPGATPPSAPASASTGGAADASGSPSTPTPSLTGAAPPGSSTDAAKHTADIIQLTPSRPEPSAPSSPAFSSDTLLELPDEPAHPSDTVWPGFGAPSESPKSSGPAESPSLELFAPDSDQPFNIERLADSPSGPEEDSASDAISPAHFVADALHEGGAEGGVQPGESPESAASSVSGTAENGWQAGGEVSEQPSPEQSWMKESPQATWQTGPLNTEGSENAANANAFADPDGDANTVDGGAYVVSENEAGAGAYVVAEDNGEAGDSGADAGAYGGAHAGGARADANPSADVDAGIIVIEESPGFDALPAIDAPLPDLERLAATGMHAMPTVSAASEQIPQPAAASATRSVSISFERRAEPRANEDGLVPPQPVPPGREPVAPAERQEMARVDAELLDQLLNISGEASIARSRLEQQLGSFDFNLGELSRTVTRLKEQLRSLEIETEAQILHRHEDEDGHRSEFDPLELDRYSSIQQFSRALAETANDVASIQQLLENLAKDTQTLLQQQARTITELQNGLMRTRMVPFQRHVQRLARIVRQAASDTHKRAELVVEGASGELDRQVLERMLPPFEHMLRNAVVHGIEKPEDRVRAGKPEAGRIVLELHREGAEVMVRLTDDGGGMNLKAIRDKGLALGLVAAGQTLSDEDAMQLILEPGFSTAGAITQQAGRGVGMDVVATEIKRLGGALHMETKAGEGTVFTIRLPFTLAISHALVVRTGEEFYALPLPTVEGVLRLSKAEVTAHLGRDASAFDYGGQKYRFQHLATFVSLEPSPLPEQDVTIPVVLVRAGEHSTGLVADELVGSREIVVKSVGPQISSIRGISGATILGDGRIVIILDIGALVRAEWRTRPQTPVVPKEKGDKRVFAMVVDDSITVRRVTQRLLERNGMRVLTARDGMDAVALLQDNVPDIILLDIEMPRMDGYEVAAHVRNDPRLKDVPIIMITSRVGEKHRARAIELGVDDYLGKPYQEAQLLEAIAPLVERRRMAIGSHLYAAELG
ncbi:MAG: type pili sensor histidine kinase and response regulator [Gammaproteobacteria bacterium]|nr:type pili sensor histidine kinase and response regulator [Gammaproteobacteria bacterium]